MSLRDSIRGLASDRFPTLRTRSIRIPLATPHRGARTWPMSNSSRTISGMRYHDYISWSAFALAVPVFPGEAALLSDAHERLQGLSDHEMFSAERAKNGYTVVRCTSVSEILVLSETERKNMLEHVRENHMFGMDADSFLGYEEALANPHA
jgi:hypothetical protein